ncbi:trimeric intracellular cation channel family protein [Aeromicrobium wangtongii]|uniref:Trimeric intracellular cation channel family protein n=1 Tax=Aeromicrobium wangtongii TaxID=2969247 RepID=A0ABY5MAI5_9ACTN|nr:trimeric intracellular cation channel family protein [Aeromicrobium wangtongii]MCD9197654.1 trimeric intracellular cation channel family protein [Aeromicrobium wangtongii]UUP15139.1 trimeric intracellular cation channel family protein [Aeromicrobium wangtongii]
MSSTLLLILELFGIAVFASTGALVGVRKELDVFGVAVLALMTGLGGGVLRDLLIGSVPPNALEDWRYLVVPFVTALVVFMFHPVFGRLEREIMLLDALGLSLFCVTGAVTAGAAGLNVLSASALGMLTGVGGGMMRDVASGRVPVIFRGDLYATPAFAGALIASVVHAMDGSPWWYAVAGATCLVWRVLALLRGWSAPLPPGTLRG